MLSAYYFRHHMYTLVPRHVRDDMAWMADAGTHNVCLAVLEQDLQHAKSNIEIVCREAQRVGMQVHAVPSRWGGIVAGAPKVPSMFAAAHPEACIRKADGAPYFSGVSGPVCSIYHEATRAFFADTTARLLRVFPIAGVIWDEVKVLDVKDYSDAARQAHGAAWNGPRHLDAVAAFFEDANAAARAVRSDVVLSMFLYAHLTGPAVDRMARVNGLDYYGCDGRPWRIEDGGTLEGAGKVLLSGNGERFIAAAHQHGKGGLLLIENHAIATPDYDLLDRRMPEVLALGAEHLLYYYYPRNLDDPDRLMDILRRHLKGSGATTGSA